MFHQVYCGLHYHDSWYPSSFVSTHPGMMLMIVAYCMWHAERGEVQLFQEISQTAHYLTDYCSQRAWLRHYATSRKVAGSISDDVHCIPSNYLILPAAL
jgi:hypothetical protein